MFLRFCEEIVRDFCRVSELGELLFSSEIIARRGLNQNKL